MKKGSSGPGLSGGPLIHYYWVSTNKYTVYMCVCVFSLKLLADGWDFWMTPDIIRNTPLMQMDIVFMSTGFRGSILKIILDSWCIMCRMWELSVTGCLYFSQSMIYVFMYCVFVSFIFSVFIFWICIYGIHLCIMHKSFKWAMIINKLKVKTYAWLNITVS